MKNRIYVTLVLILVMLSSLTTLVACSSSPEPEILESADESQNDESMIIHSFNTVYYYKGLLYHIKKPLGTPALLYYIDLENGESGILCGRPECTHDSDSCNAYLDSMGDGFTIYHDKIYWMTSSIKERKLMRADIDGTNRKEVLVLDKECEWLTANKSFIEIYNDTLYRCGCGNVVAEGEPINNMLLYSQPLQQGSKPKQLYSEENVYSVVARMQGNKLYFAIIGADFDLSIYVCDLDSGEVKKLFYKEQADNSPWDIAICDNKLILYGTGPCVGIYSLTDGSYTVVGEEGKDFSWATGTKIYEQIGDKEYALYDLKGEKIAQGVVDPPGFEEENYTTRYLGSVKENMFFLFEVSYPSQKEPNFAALHNYIAAFNTDTLEWKILWDGISDY